MHLKNVNILLEQGYKESENILEDVSLIIEQAKKETYKSINYNLVKRNYLIGYRIATEELKGNIRADYGENIIKKLSLELTNKYGKGFNRSNLYHFLNFYKMFPEIVYTLCRQSNLILSWSHYRILLQIYDKEARNWYENEAIMETWSVRTLQRNVDTQYYYRLLKSQSKNKVKREMQSKTKDSKLNKLEFIKDPVIAEFLGYSLDKTFTESDLETSIINNLQKFLMELGKGYAFVSRQQHIHTANQDYYIDLVFYNYILKCFVLIDLKTSRITHQDVGQMDMYVRMYDELKKSENDNPTIGILLCSQTDEDIAKYSILKGNEQLFATKYKLYLPTEEELRCEIETQKELFDIKNND